MCSIRVALLQGGMMIDHRERLLAIMRRLHLEDADRLRLETRIRQMPEAKAESLADKADAVFASIDRLVGELVPLVDQIRDACMGD